MADAQKKYQSIGTVPTEAPILNLLTKTLKLLIFKYVQKTKENMRLMSSSREYKQRDIKNF